MINHCYILQSKKGYNMENKIIQLNSSVISSRRDNTILCITEMDDNVSETDEYVIELSGGSNFIWELICKGNSTIDSIHESMNLEYEDYGHEQKSETKSFLEELIKLKVIVLK